MKIKFSQIFWGSFLIILGILFLVNQFTVINLSFQRIHNYWPIFLIAIGLYYLKLPEFFRYIISGTSGLLLGLFVFSMFNSNYCSRNENVTINQLENSPRKSNLSIPNDTNKVEFSLNLDFGAGDLKINDISSQLLDIYETNAKDLLFVENLDSVKNIINLSSQANITFNDKFLERDANIKLNPTKIWNISANLGAVSANFDLTKFKIKEFELNTGATSVVLKIGELFDSTKINIESGASKVKIYLPKTSGCRVFNQTSLSKNKFIDFIQLNEEEFQTDNFDNSPKKIYINLNGGVSKYIIERY